ncbi:MAG: AfsR/SARP family transcriptional regulator, partial [Chloroflexota bacterium]
MSTITYRQEMRNCGKTACRRCRDGSSHGPYWYAYWRGDDGKVHKRYHGKTPPPVPTTGSHEALSRETPEWSASRLHIRMLGGLEIQRGGTPLTAGEKLSLPARRLLAILLLQPAGLSREEAAEMLWPARAPGVAERALRTALTTLRSLLNSSPDQRLPRRQSLLCLNLQPGDWVDTHA